jgi:hypothetical protein
MSMLIRINLNRMATEKLERILAQGEASDAKLSLLQHEIKQEAEQRLFLNAARGERAQGDRTAQAVERGELDSHSLVSGPGRWDLFFNILHIPPIVKLSRGRLLQYNNALVEIAKLPVEEQIGKIKKLVAAEEQDPPGFGVRSFGHILGNSVALFHRDRAGLGCALAMIATERYRLTNMRWPRGLEELVPTYLPNVPLDPFSGKELRYHRLNDGVVIYSVGPDGEANGGRFDKDANRRGREVSCRLWDVPKRRQLPKPPAQAAHEQE